jgi:hypothetical protein
VQVSVRLYQLTKQLTEQLQAELHLCNPEHSPSPRSGKD